MNQKNKTKKQLERIAVEIDECYPNEYNSNKMPEKKFEALVDTIRRYGQTNDVQVVRDEKGKYRIVGGEHRWRAMKLLKYKTVNVIVREFEDDIDEQLGSVEDNLRGNPVPIKEALIVANATKKYKLKDLQKRFGQDESELKDKLFLLGEEEKIKKIEESLNKEHTLEMDFVVDTDVKENAEVAINRITAFAKLIGIKVADSKLKIAKGKETVALLTFNVTDPQRKVIEQALNDIQKSEEVSKSRALELICADWIAGSNPLPKVEKTRQKVKKVVK